MNDGSPVLDFRIPLEYLTSAKAVDAFADRVAAPWSLASLIAFSTRWVCADLEHSDNPLLA